MCKKVTGKNSNVACFRFRRHAFFTSLARLWTNYLMRRPGTIQWLPPILTILYIVAAVYWGMSALCVSTSCLMVAHQNRSATYSTMTRYSKKFQNFTTGMLIYFTYNKCSLGHGTPYLTKFVSTAHGSKLVL